MSCNLGKTRTRFTVNSLVFVILFWFLVENFKLSARTKDARDMRDAFLESVYPCIEIDLYGRHIRTLHCHEKEAQKQGAEDLVGNDAFVTGVVYISVSRTNVYPDTKNYLRAFGLNLNWG